MQTQGSRSHRCLPKKFFLTRPGLIAANIDHRKEQKKKHLDYNFPGITVISDKVTDFGHYGPHAQKWSAMLRGLSLMLEKIAKHEKDAKNI